MKNNFTTIAWRDFGAKLIMQSSAIEANFVYHEFLSTQSAMNLTFVLHIQLMDGGLRNDFLIVSLAGNGNALLRFDAQM